MVGVEFYPWVAIRLLGPSTSNALDPCTIPAQVSPGLAARIQRLLVAGEQAEALRAIEEWLLARAARIDLEPTPAMLVATRLVETSGLGNGAGVADSVGLSMRQRERPFREQVGMSPKSLARLTRFEAAQRRIIG